MAGQIKLTKRQIKEDKFTTFMLTTKDRMMDNWQFVAIGAVVIIVLVAAIVYYHDSQEAAVADAGERFARAQLDYRTGDRQIAILGLSQILEEYGSQEIAEQATFLLGKYHLVDRNYPEAIRYFELYLSKYRDYPLNRAAALAGVAACLENQGEYASAAERFAQAADEYPDGPLEADYRLGALRNYLEIGDNAGAEEQLNRIDGKYEGTIWSVRGQRLFFEKGHAQSGT